MVLEEYDHFILQQLVFCIPRVIQNIENTRTPTEINFNSSPCIGNIDSPPTAPSITASGAVHAGHPGVNAANAPPNTADEFVLTEFIIFILLILYAISAILTPPSAEIKPVSVTDVMIYVESLITFKCIGNRDIVKI